LWKGGTGFNVERWRFWKERLAAVDTLDVAEATKEDSAKALTAMEAAEDTLLECADRMSRLANIGGR
jgi:hypothetical protein